MGLVVFSLAILGIEKNPAQSAVDEPAGRSRNRRARFERVVPGFAIRSSATRWRGAFTRGGDE